MLGEQDVDMKRAWLKGILFECPAKDELDECPVREIRMLNLPDGLDKVDLMTVEEIDELLECHDRCLAVRAAMI